MKKNKSWALAMVAVAAVGLLGSCELLETIFKAGPEVSLAITSGNDASIWSNETVEVSATVDTASGLTFAWYLDGQEQADIDTLAVSYTAPDTAVDTSHELSIIVTDANNKTTTKRIVFRITASSTLYIVNRASDSLATFYVSPSSADNWGQNMLSEPLLPGKSYKIYGMEQGNWDIQYSFSASLATKHEKIVQAFLNGTPRLLDTGTHILSATTTGPSGSVSTVPMPNQQRLAP